MAGVCVEGEKILKLKELFKTKIMIFFDKYKQREKLKGINLTMNNHWQQIQNNITGLMPKY